MDDNELAPLRQRIDDLDARVIEILGERFAVCAQIARVKCQRNLPMMQHSRIAAVKERAVTLGTACRISPGFITAMYDLIIAEACRIEDDLLRPGTSGARRG